MLAFLPFFVYFVAVRLFGIMIALTSATIVSAIMLMRDALNSRRSVKILEVGTVLLFGGLAAYVYFKGGYWPIAAVRLRVDIGLLLIVLVSIALRWPFTLQYAREQVAREYWTSDGFVRTNYIITAVWGAAFALMVIADLLLLYATNLPRWIGVVVTIAALLGAFRFTEWYPKRQRSS
ncbi:hypothetical protein [Acidobacterium sp. S8]|uniref:hypothetical protein n=1 Tax=Acidobacterium sp. S8 TaxID=1641854 RepID=UPI001C204A2F|nr:hypothetical protein [Acidobacterium sp. S8]